MIIAKLESEFETPLCPLLSKIQEVFVSLCVVILYKL
jgi:hypothetical protein